MLTGFDNDFGQQDSEQRGVLSRVKCQTKSI